ncbi:MAG TPA: response regulator [Ktedonobacteraceae bacterium]|nr:response regulator [Ktedonobacteraceae bacterium]
MAQGTEGTERSVTDEPVRPIVVVEDDRDLGDMLMEALGQETFYPVLYAQNIPEAIDILSAVTPSLLILDYQLCSANGLHLYDHLHAAQRLDPSQVIMMSARLPRKELQARQLQGIEKPFELTDFLGLVEEMLSGQEETVRLHAARRPGDESHL